MKKMNTSFLLALLVNVGFLLFLLFEKSINWLFQGWIINTLLFLYFLSLLFALIEALRKSNKGYLYSALFLNLIGLILFLNYWFRL